MSMLVTSATATTTSIGAFTSLTTARITSTGVTSTEVPSTLTPATSLIPTGFCYNGGTHDGIKCLCTPIFYGPLCEFSTESIDTNLPFPGTIMAQAELNVTVTNFNFTKDLLDPTSEAYGAFEELFQRESMRIYGTISGYEGVRILTLSPGSIVVTHEVFFTLVVPKNVSQDMEDITQSLVQTLKDVEAGQGLCQHETDILCLKVPPDPVIRSMTETSDLDELCRIRAPPGYSQFYFTDTAGGLISCITACTPNRPTSLDCHYGQCRVTLQGPSCFCQDEAFFWYSGPQCSGRISKVATGLGLVATVLLLTCIVLGIIVARERQRRRMLRSPP
ncbi:mucin-3A-like [Pezoporus flaviventris]|uniref:mucin-3A-like n=1 Tax=Pezoporus flaviventris TaxID=889875 RepID=UPI002AB05FA2|nr:mucin-3A-like [Pezoporus flaviventris]